VGAVPPTPKARGPDARREPSHAPAPRPSAASRLIRPGAFRTGRFTLLAGLIRHARLYVRLLGDRRVPRFPKLLVAAAVAYALVPMDLVPDLLVPLAGYLDDLVLLWLALRALVRLSPPAVVAEHLAAARCDAQPSR